MTVFNRGTTNEGLFPGVARLFGDRYAGDVVALRGGAWDGVIDVNGYEPAHVDDVLAALDGRVGHYTFVSTVSVYAPSTSPIDESAALDDVLRTEGVPYENYGPHKVHCERAVEAAYGARSTIIRPGIVAGPHDPTERFTHWVRAAAAGEEIVATRPDQPVQVIHGRDQGDFVVKVTTEGRTGRFNTTGPTAPVTMEGLVAACCEAAGTSPDIRWITEEEAAVSELAFPLVLPRAEGVDGLFMASCAAAVAAGLVNRPLVETASDTLAWTLATR